MYFVSDTLPPPALLAFRPKEDNEDHRDSYGNDFGTDQNNTYDNAARNAEMEDLTLESLSLHASDDLKPSPVPSDVHVGRVDDMSGLYPYDPPQASDTKSRSSSRRSSKSTSPVPRKKQLTGSSNNSVVCSLRSNSTPSARKASGDVTHTTAAMSTSETSVVSRRSKTSKVQPKSPDPSGCSYGIDLSGPPHRHTRRVAKKHITEPGKKARVDSSVAGLSPGRSTRSSTRSAASSTGSRRRKAGSTVLQS